MITVPNIAYRNLTSPAVMTEVDGSRRLTYIDAQIKRAVESGIGAEGGLA